MKGFENLAEHRVDRSRQSSGQMLALHTHRIRNEFCFIFICVFIGVKTVGLLTCLMNSRNELSLVKLSESLVRFKTQGLAEIFQRCTT